MVARECGKLKIAKAFRESVHFSDDLEDLPLLLSVISRGSGAACQSERISRSARFVPPPANGDSGAGGQKRKYLSVSAGVSVGDLPR
ncbi:MAG: hypothetical protein ACI8UO_006623 [Verrucomicrobiales bacterium]|jgi:hypothetical protein